MNFLDAMEQDGNKYAPRMDGVMIGVITNNKDPEKLGRVKLKFPLREDQHETDWVRVATLMTGSSMGTYFIPEVGDEVLVAFQMGDLRMPFVIGSLWNKKKKPPAVKMDKNEQRTITSKSGHEITFDDKANGSITIKTKKGQTISLDDAKSLLQFQDDSKGNQLSIEGGSKNEILIKSGSSKISINNKGDVVVESAKSLKVKSVQVSIEASGKLEIKGGASVDIKSSGLLNIKGSMVKIN